MIYKELTNFYTFIVAHKPAILATPQLTMTPRGLLTVTLLAFLILVWVPTISLGRPTADQDVPETANPEGVNDGSGPTFQHMPSRCPK